MFWRPQCNSSTTVVDQSHSFWLLMSLLLPVGERHTPYLSRRLGTILLCLARPMYLLGGCRKNLVEKHEYDRFERIVPGKGKQ